jgi:hypothetical protein
VEIIWRTTPAQYTNQPNADIYMAINYQHSIRYEMGATYLDWNPSLNTDKLEECRRVGLVRTDVSEEPRASFISVTRIVALGTLAVTSNQRILRRNTTPHSVTSQKTTFFSHCRENLKSYTDKQIQHRKHRMGHGILKMK